jgi:peroxiredoxin
MNVMKFRMCISVGLLVTLLSGCDNAEVVKEAITSPSGYSDVASVTLEVGSSAPDFKLQSLDGGWVQLSELLGKKVLMIFYRGHWCPFCVGHLQDIQSLLPELEKRGYQVLAISPEDATDMQKIADRMDRPYRFLSDINLKVTDLYGIRRDEELPHPAMIVLDDLGIVKWFYVGENYKQRPSAQQLRKVLDRIKN